MRLLQALATRPADPEPMNGPPFTYGRRSAMSIPGSDPTRADSTFESMVTEIHNKNSAVSAAVTARALLLSQVVFAYADMSDPAAPLEFNASTDRLNSPGSMPRSSLLMRMEQDASYAGAAIVVSRRTRPGLFRLDPTRVTMVFGSNSDPTWSAGEMRLPYDAQLTGIIYNSAEVGTAGWNSPRMEDLELFELGEFVYWAPEPDPIHWWRGQSWIASLLEDVSLDGQISDHQSKFFEHAATPNLVFLMDPQRSQDEVKAYAEIVNAKHSGARNAWRNMFLGGAVDVKTVGTDLSKLSLKDIQGGLETRIAMRSRVPAVVLGAREGLSGSSLNTGNYSAARRLLADGWFSPYVGGLCEAFEAIAPPPRRKRLTHDPSKVLFLQEDRKDEAEINQTKVTAIRALADGGFDPATAVAVVAPEWSGKLDHTGRLSVQLQEPGADSANAVRAVMGRLGRYDDAEMVDPDLVVSGLDPDAAATVLAVLGAHEPDETSMTDLRAAVRAALTTGD